MGSLIKELLRQSAPKWRRQRDANTESKKLRR
jgi:hypothetical protein